MPPDNASIAAAIPSDAQIIAEATALYQPRQPLEVESKAGIWIDASADIHELVYRTCRDPTDLAFGRLEIREGGATRRVRFKLKLPTGRRLARPEVDG